MIWQEIRQAYPNQWLLVEAIRAHSVGDKRILDQLAVVKLFPDSVSAMRSYQALHQLEPERELYVLHSSRAVLDITEQRWLGIRGVR